MHKFNLNPRLLLGNLNSTKSRVLIGWWAFCVVIGLTHLALRLPYSIVIGLSLFTLMLSSSLCDLELCPNWLLW